MRPKFPPTALLVILTLLGVSGAHAQFITPTSYSFSVAPDSGYPDNTGSDLINGTLGISFSNTFDAAQLAAWTGWQNQSPSITFKFATAQTFSLVEIGTSRWNAASVGQLASVTIGSFNFTTGIALANDVRDWVPLSGSFSTTFDGSFHTLAISLTGAQQWIELDEVRFTAVPEPAETVAVISLAAAGALVASRRCRQGSLRVT